MAFRRFTQRAGAIVVLGLFGGILASCSPAPAQPRNIASEMTNARIDTLVERSNRLEARIVALEAEARNRPN